MTHYFRAAARFQHVTRGSHTLTLRELWQMAEARQRDNWSHTSVALALTANIHRDPKKAGRFKPDDFNPFAAKKPVVIKAGIGILKQVFVDNRRGD